MPYLSIWITVHRGLLIGLAGLLFWVAAYLWYLKGDFRRHMRANKAHRWSVDMATRTGKGGKRGMR